MRVDRDREEQALDWLRRTHDPSFDDWESHLAWLEADPANIDAFDRVLMTIDDATVDLIESQRHDSAASNDNIERTMSPPSRLLGWGARVTALAASLAAMIGLTTLLRPPLPIASQSVGYTTDLGQRRTVRLSDGTTIAMNGGSSIRVDGGRRLSVDRGEVYLNVVHDSVNPLRVAVGDVDLVDAGTQFNVRREESLLTVSVNEGMINYDPKGAAIRLAAGQQLRRSSDGVVLDRVDREAVGGWRNGRLIYRDAPLTSVAADLTRATGEAIVIEPSARAIRFSGAIAIDPDHTRLFHRLAAVADVRVRRYKDAWRVAASGD